MHKYSKPILGLTSIRSGSYLRLISEYEGELVESGYNSKVVRLHLHSVAHLGVWLQIAGVSLEAIDEDAVVAFDQHRPACTCPGTSGDRGRHVVSCVRVFVRYLRERGVVQSAGGDPAVPDALISGFCRWLRADRGVVATTVNSYQQYVADLVDCLGSDPSTYSARDLRDFVARRYRHYRCNSMRMVLAAIRMFLRYLAAEGRCRSGLEHALMSPANWSQQSLPRGLTSEQIDRVLTLCPSTATGIRDRAILLLLLRLGFRAGDVAHLRLSDLCFDSATIRVAGKGKRETRLPLPQDVGDAMLEYLRARRQVRGEHVFVRALAPFEPFRSSRAVGHVARSALKRADVQPPSSGAHVFRHTAACQMLREGAGLESIAEILRHRSIETTGLYAKVDEQLLEQVAQPWPGAESC